MRPLYGIGLTFNIPTFSPQQYLSLSLRGLGFDTFQTNLLSIPYLVLKSMNTIPAPLEKPAKIFYSFQYDGTGYASGVHGTTRRMRINLPILVSAFSYLFTCRRYDSSLEMADLGYDFIAASSASRYSTPNP